MSLPDNFWDEEPEPPPVVPKAPTFLEQVEKSLKRVTIDVIPLYDTCVYDTQGQTAFVLESGNPMEVHAPRLRLTPLVLRGDTTALLTTLHQYSHRLWKAMGGIPGQKSPGRVILCFLGNEVRSRDLVLELHLGMGAILDPPTP